MNIYGDYINKIESAMNSGESRMFSDSFEQLSGNIQKGFNTFGQGSRITGNSLLPSLRSFAEEMNLKVDFTQQLGAHPDFRYLKHSNNTERHYIVSAFFDVKKSTNLFRKYNQETVLVINDTIMKAAIHTCVLFQGYVHRLQGDGLFVYFGGKGKEKSLAVEQALLASSVFSYFVKNDLKKLFDKKGVENIYTRTGIDLGYDEDVLWFNAGIEEISEVTTSSLHTSLAPKMQANAVSNGIVIGDNVRDNTSSNLDLISPVCNRTRNERDRYIFEIPDKKFRYTQYDFDWLSYLRRQDFIATGIEGNLIFKKRIKNESISLAHLKPIAIKSRPYWDFIG